jgi:hypothetical protein
MARRIQIWEDSASFRGELKKCAREVVRLLYDLFPDAGKGKQSQMQHVKQAVDDLLRGGDFMHNGTDDEVSIIVRVMAASHAWI